ncbi:MAG: DUF5320 domain-containing protein [Deltaproteobacteria bacterium]|nr:MAG: DUF5320 domain-containing protein [Deltaproteobacteria bacterium]
MYYGSYPHAGWFSPWGPPMGMGYPMASGWGYPYGGMPQMPYYPPLGGFGGPGMSPFGPLMAPEQEIAFLREQAQMLKEQMDQIDARIKELEKATK